MKNTKSRMKLFFTFLILVAAGFSGGYGAAHWRTLEFLSSKFTSGSKVLKSSLDFQATLYPVENLPFCVVIIGRNNGAYLEKTLASIFSQNYENFRVVYVDDASDDGSYDLARDLIYASPHFNKVQFLHHEHPLGFLANLASIVRGCEDKEIIVIVHSEDWLAHEWVLSTLNQYYADPDLWLTYGQFFDYPTYQRGNARSLKEQSVRSSPFGATHLKTFYAALFKKIHESDFKYKGEYFQAAVDLAYMFPMLEMAFGHTQCLSEILYICNRESLKTESRDQPFFEKHIRSLESYPQLVSLTFSCEKGANQ